MFERFGSDARAAVVSARQEAVNARQDHIGCEHLLLGLLAGPGPGREALTEAGLDLAGLRALVPRGDAAGPDPLDAAALATLGIDLDAVRRAASAAFGQGALDRVTVRRRDKLRLTGGIRMSAGARKSLELALRAAARDRSGHLSSGHLLIGILDQADNAALDALQAASIDIQALRADLQRRMSTAA